MHFQTQGELTITSEMEEMEVALFMDFVPETWASKAYPSLLGFSAWFSDLQMRLKELEAWVADFLVGKYMISDVITNR